MGAEEYCAYTRAYSEIEGLQIRHTLTYSASRAGSGAVLALRAEQGGNCCTSSIYCPQCRFERVMNLMRYLCENGVGMGQWLEVLEDAGLRYHPLGMEQGAPFVSFADFKEKNLLHNTELTQWV